MLLLCFKSLFKQSRSQLSLYCIASPIIYSSSVTWTFSPHLLTYKACSSLVDLKSAVSSALNVLPTDISFDSLVTSSKSLLTCLLVNKVNLDQLLKIVTSFCHPHLYSSYYVFFCSCFLFCIVLFSNMMWSLGGLSLLTCKLYYVHKYH